MGSRTVAIRINGLEDQPQQPHTRLWRISTAAPRQFQSRLTGDCGFVSQAGQVMPFMRSFQHVSKHPKQKIKKPVPLDPRRVAKNVLSELAVKVLARVNVRKTFR